MPKPKTTNQTPDVAGAQAAGYPPLAYDVRITSLDLSGGAKKASVSVNLNGGFAVRGIQVKNGSNGLFVSMPAYKSGDGYRDVCFPCTKEERPLFDKAVLGAYEQAVQNLSAGGQAQGEAAPAASQAEAAGNPPLVYDVRITSLTLNGSSKKASATLNINDKFAVRGIKVMDGSKGLFVSMPSYKSGNTYKDVCFPCTKEERLRLDQTVMDAYTQAVQQMHTNSPQEQGYGQAPPPPTQAQAGQEMTM